MVAIRSAHSPLRIRELPATERPCQRLHALGAGALSDIELLAIVVNLATFHEAQAIFTTAGGWAGLHRATMTDLTDYDGIGHAKAAQIKAALEIGRRLALVQPGARFTIRSPQDVVTLLQLEMSHLDQEHLRVICVDTKNQVQQIVTVYIGSLNSSLIRISEVFKAAIRLNSAAIVVVHNHPSGQPEPSPEDLLVNRQLIEAGKLLDIDLMDHVIIGAGQHVSLRQLGLGGF